MDDTEHEAREAAVMAQVLRVCKPIADSISARPKVLAVARLMAGPAIYASIMTAITHLVAEGKLQIVETPLEDRPDWRRGGG